jgi:chaperone required for assembly of F1-ATPase
MKYNHVLRYHRQQPCRTYRSIRDQSGVLLQAPPQQQQRSSSSFTPQEITSTAAPSQSPWFRSHHRSLINNHGWSMRRTTSAVLRTKFSNHSSNSVCGRRMSSSSSDSSSSTNNIQSQQRIKRFYKTVHVVPVDKVSQSVSNTTTTTPNFLYPQLPPSQLRSTTHTSPNNNIINNDNSSTTSTSTTTNNDKQWYTITLDGKQLRTPLGQVVVVPSITLAHLIAIEWNAVTSHIVPNQMPLMTYVCTVLDQVMKQKQHYEQLCFQYVMTDTLGYPANPIFEPILYQQQQKAWLPIQHWMHASFVGSGSNTASTTIGSGGDSQNNDTVAPWNPTTTPSSKFTLPSVLVPQLQRQPKQSTIPSNAHQNNKKNVLSSPLSQAHTTFVQKIPYDPELLLAIQQFIATLDVWYLLALYIGCKECKSFWLSCALVITNARNHRANDAHPAMVFTPQQIQTAARLEEEMNIQDWGLVEGQHDYDRLNAAIQIRSVALFVQSLNPSSM